MNGIVYESPCGQIRLAVDGGAVCAVDWIEVTERLVNSVSSMEDKTVLSELIRQLDEYFCGERRNFELQLRTSGTDFQQAVWRELLKIPYGETVSYSEIAKRIGRPTAVRAVGHAIHCNPIGILIPCHRVIAADGKLAGFAGGLEAKRFLLALEQKHTALL